MEKIIFVIFVNKLSFDIRIFRPTWLRDPTWTAFTLWSPCRNVTKMWKLRQPNAILSKHIGITWCGKWVVFKSLWSWHVRFVTRGKLFKVGHSDFTLESWMYDHLKVTMWCIENATFWSTLRLICDNYDVTMAPHRLVIELLINYSWIYKYAPQRTVSMISKITFSVKLCE